MAPDLHFLTIAEAAELIAARRLSPVELTEAYLARIAALDDQLDSFVTVTSERARRDARKAEAEVMASGPRGPLHGIPYCLKDIFDVAGVRTTAQSRLLAINVAGRGQRLCGEAGGGRRDFARQERDIGVRPWRAVLGRALSAGAQPLEHRSFAFWIFFRLGGCSRRGTCADEPRLRHRRLHSRPRRCLRRRWLKPTYGRVSRRGIVPNCFSHDHAGPLAWTSRDVALIMTVIAGHDPDDPGSAAREVPDYVAALTGSVEGLVIGVPWRWLEDEMPPSPATRRLSMRRSASSGRLAQRSARSPCRLFSTITRP